MKSYTIIVKIYIYNQNTLLLLFYIFVSKMRFLNKNGSITQSYILVFYWNKTNG